MKRTVWTTIAVAVLVALTAAAGYYTGGFRYWFGRRPVTPVTPGAVIDDQGRDLTQGAHQIPKGMTFLAANTAGITLTATVTPADADDKAILWTFAWADPADPWIANAHAVLTDYLTVTPDAENSGRAVVTCPRAFGAKIKLTAAAKANPALTYECMVDYAKRISSVYYELTGSKNGEKFPVNPPSDPDQSVLSLDTVNDYYTIRPIIRWTTGTVQPVLIKEEIFTVLSSSFKRFLTRDLGQTVPDVISANRKIVTGYDTVFNQYGIDALYNGPALVHNGITRYLRSVSDPTITVYAELETAYQTFDSAASECSLCLIGDGFTIVPESVTVDSGAIVL